MSDDIKGVFVRLPLSDRQKRLVKLSYSGSMNSYDGFSKACIAIGTPVTDGELPTEVVRVREHCKDIELPWTYHKVPPSDQDASEYELEFDRLITHKQVIAKLAEKDAEIARLQNALRRIIGIAHDLPEFLRIEAMQKEAEEALKGPEA